MENKNRFLMISIISSLIISTLAGSGFGFFAGYYYQKIKDIDSRNVFLSEQNEENIKVVKVQEESAVISVVEAVAPAVVSIVVTKDLPVYERFYQERPYRGDIFDYFFGDELFRSPQYRQKGTEEREIGGGTGFIISEDGFIVTNKHVVADEEADYTVFLNDDEEKYEAKVLARDPFTDLAILKIEEEELPFVELGDSSSLKVGQTVIAIGNSLGEFRNTVSKGVISGMSRSIVAGGAASPAEQLIGLIQTDASINPGNSGGPLINIEGQVIGINTAMAAGAENIGFTIPINDVKNTIETVKQEGRIIRPWLGIRYVQIDEEIKEANKLSVDYGALIVRGENRTEMAVMPGSPADKAGLVEGDIIIEINDRKIDEEYFLAKAISEFRVGEKIKLKILHKGDEKTIEVKLEEMK